MDLEKELDKVEFADGTTRLISREAGVYLAAHVKTNKGEYNSMDG